MGFHLVNRVYADVKGTSPVAQSVLAFLAHKADDKGERKCYPAVETISSCTHFSPSGIRKALNELREADLLRWKSGGRKAGGIPYANEYTFNLPPDPVSTGKPDVAPAGATSGHLQESRDSACRSHVVAPINPYQSNNRPSVIAAPVVETDGISANTEAGSAKLRRMYEEIGRDWELKRGLADEARELRRHERISVVAEAMKAAGVKDPANRKIFTSTILLRDPDQCLEVIFRFDSERRAGEHRGLRNPAACLNELLSRLPIRTS